MGIKLKSLEEFLAEAEGKFISVSYKDILKIAGESVNTKDEETIIEWVDYAGQILRDNGSKNIVNKINGGTLGIATKDNHGAKKYDLTFWTKPGQEVTSDEVLKEIKKVWGK